MIVKFNKAIMSIDGLVPVLGNVQAMDEDKSYFILTLAEATVPQVLALVDASMNLSSPDGNTFIVEPKMAALATPAPVAQAIPAQPVPYGVLGTMPQPNDIPVAVAQAPAPLTGVLLCNDCGNPRTACTCHDCDECGNHEDECTCHICDDCGEHEDNCTCGDEERADGWVVGEADDSFWPRNSISQICEHTIVEDAAFDGKHVYFKTTEIAIGNKQIGQFIVKMKAGASPSVTFTNVTRTMRNGGTTAQHPHVRGGSACFGSIGSSITSCISNGDFVTAATLIIGFLQQANESDSWGSSITHWPEA